MSLAVAVSFFVVSMTVILAYQMEPWLVVIPMWVVPVSFLIVRLLTPFAHHFVLIPVSSDAFGGQGPPVWVWDDALGQKVLDELESRWRARLRSLHAVIDPDNDAQREAAKFQWLRENELVDEAEYQAALGEIEVHCSFFGSERSVN